MVIHQKWARSLSGAIGLLGFVCSGAVLAAPPPVAVFAPEPEFDSPDLSPNGQLIAYLTYAAGKRVLAVLNLATAQAKPVLTGEVDTFLLSWCSFKTDERLVCSFRGHDYQDGRPFSITRLVSVNSDGSHPKVLVQNGRAGLSQFQDRIMHWLPNDPQGVLIQLSESGKPFPAVYRLDVVSGRLTRVQREREPITGWLADRQGIVRFGYGYRGDKGVYLARSSATGEWRTLARFELFDHEVFDPLGFGPLGDTLLIDSLHNGRGAIFEMDLEDRSDRQLLFSRPDVDVGGAIHWPSDQRIVGFSYERDKPHKHFIDSRAARIQATLDKALPDAINSVIGSSRDEQRILVSAYSDVKPTTYYLLDLTKMSLNRVASDNSALANVTLAPHQPVSIKALDGTQMPGYLTIPVGSAGKNLPTVIYPHGPARA